MSYDTDYGCPCGSGKKVRYCCGKAVVADLDKIMRAYHGGQQIAALQLVETALKKHPATPSLLALRAELKLALGKSEELAETVALLLERMPESQVGLALSCIVAAQALRLDEAIDRLQDGLDVAVDTTLHPLVTTAVGILARFAYRLERPEVALVHFRVQMSMQREDGPDAEEAASAIRALVGANELPLQLRAVPVLAEIPGEEHRDAYVDATHAAQLGRWRRASELFRGLLEAGADERPVLHNLALMQINLGRRQEACSALRRLANLPDVEEQLAVEAEALAQLLDQEREPTVALIEVEVPIRNADTAQERLLANRRFVAAAVPPRDEDDDEPPAKAAFGLADQEPPLESAEITWRDMPTIRGRAVLYGRQTDRDARLVYIAYGDEQFEADKQFVLDCLGDAAGSPTQHEDPDSRINAAEQTFGWEWYFPAWLDVERRRQFAQQKRQAIMEEIWPNTRFGFLDLQRPVDVAQDPKYRIPLLAALLNLQLDCLESGWDFDVRPVRRTLGLPDPEPVTRIDSLIDFPLERLLRLDPSVTSDDQLFELTIRALVSRFRPGVLHLLPEVERRKEQLRQRLPMVDVYFQLAEMASDPEEGLQLLNRAREDAEQRRLSPARILLASIPLLMLTGRGEELVATIDTLKDRHLKEPGVAETLMQLLSQIQAGSRLARGSAGNDTAAAEPAPAPSSGLWTPEQSEGTGASGAKKIWIPGMD